MIRGPNIGFTRNMGKTIVGISFARTGPTPGVTGTMFYTTIDARISATI